MTRKQNRQDGMKPGRIKYMKMGIRGGKKENIQKVKQGKKDVKEKEGRKEKRKEQK
jgi:Cys-tRNA synthase (O-phospho-L-seryl-tRNA:Cys-tRNA synthase)